LTVSAAGAVTSRREDGSTNRSEASYTARSFSIDTPGATLTVIGPAVNLVSRIEAVAKALDQPIVVSDDFARAYGGPLQPLGRHELRGLATPHDLFAPAASASVT
jgi:class 3 adenylate cyclase